MMHNPKAQCPGKGHPWHMECPLCGLSVDYCSGCFDQTFAEYMAGAHSRGCGGRVTLVGPDLRLTIGASVARAG